MCKRAPAALRASDGAHMDDLHGCGSPAARVGPVQAMLHQGLMSAAVQCSTLACSAAHLQPLGLQEDADDTSGLPCIRETTQHKC